MSATPRRPLLPSIATWIAGISLLALMPMMAFSAYVVYREITEQQDQAKVALRRRATVAAAAIGRELDSVFAELLAMSQAEVVGRGELMAVHALAQRVVQSDPRVASIAIIDAHGAMPFITALPYGAALPPVDPAPLRPLFESGKRLVSPFARGVVSGQPVVTLASPVDMGKAGRFALRAALQIDAIGARLNEQAWPTDWAASVVDQDTVILARSRNAAQFIGQPATASAQEGLQRPGEIFHSVTKDGVEVVSAAAPVPGSGWHVVVGRPLAELRAQVGESMLTLLVAGVLCSLVAAGGALYLARSIRRQLDAVVRSQAGADAAPLRTSIREVAELSEALTVARVTAARASVELLGAREQVLVKLSERSEMLDVLAHEVRQPLNNASAALQAALAPLKRADAALAGGPLLRAVGVLAEVQASIDNTLAVAALLVGQQLAREDTDIDALIAVAIGDLPEADAGRVRVERLTATRTASMDASLMRLALRNLLSNALKYSPRDMPVLVRVADSDEPLALLIDVVDCGPGIAPELLAQLFERADRRPAGASGSRRKGLGLYIVRRVMELHGGSVKLQHNGPDGSTMRLVIDQAGDDD